MGQPPSQKEARHGALSRGFQGQNVPTLAAAMAMHYTASIANEHTPICHTACFRASLACYGLGMRLALLAPTDIQSGLVANRSIDAGRLLLR